MKINEKFLASQSREALKKCLSGIPFLKIKSIKNEVRIGNMQIDYVIFLDISGKPKKLMVEIKNNGQPAIVRNASNQLLRLKEQYPDAYFIVMAPYISEASAEILIKDEIGYMDLSGNCRLTFENVFIENKGRPNKFAQKRDLRSLYSPKAARVLRVLLNDPKKSWKIQALAKEANISLGLCANVKKLLVNREWISFDEEGIRIKEAKKLLVEWANNYSFRKNRVMNLYSLKNQTELEKELAEICKKKNIQYALTGFSGAARLAPAVRDAKSMIYMSGLDIARISESLGLKEVESGSNVMILVPYDGGVFYKSRLIQHAVVVSPTQIYLDLKGFRGRGDEAAEFFFKQVIKPTW